MIIDVIHMELQDAGFVPDWYDCDRKAIVIKSVYEFNIWIKDTWIYYWWEDRDGDPYTRRIDLNDPRYMDLLTRVLVAPDPLRI